MTAVPDAGFAARHAVLAAGYGDRPDPDDPGRVLAMPLVLHIPKPDPPERSALLAAAAVATIAVCLDERVGVGCDGEPGPWHAAYRAWTDARIRKVARRARGAHWRAAQEVDGVTVDVRGAQARAFVPTEVGALDPRLRKLQIGGTDLEPDDPGEPAADAPVLWLNARLGMTVGKAAAQVGHAAMILAGAMTVDRAAMWAADGYRCSVRDADPELWSTLVRAESDGRAIAVRDAGFTEVAPGSMTVIAVPARG
ncbi:aminoacyl-tRNA hydrolase [Rhodococcus sp. NPDC058532]|uniref:aminoacyl-tRNA hydrolase n=1 Tax=Rhodococcus sp. NPDC058532 TaxID=3346540 RepID=UPI0036491C1D